MAERLSYRHLRVILKEAARRAFDEVRHLHADESFYVFALHTSDEATYAVPSANSEEGLRRKLAEYAKEGFAADEQTLRWNACDWVYHTAGKNYFSEVQQFIDDAINKVGAETSVAAWERRTKRLFEVFLHSLRDLDAEGFFGSGEERNRILLLLTIGDCDQDTILTWAKQLNPPAAFQRFKDSFSTHVGKYREMGSRKFEVMRSLSLSGDRRLLAAAGWDHLLVFALPKYEEILKKRVATDQCVGMGRFGSYA